MKIKNEFVNISSGTHSIRTLLSRPVQEGTYPGIIFFSDIFQITAPMLRACSRLAGHGFVVAAPEIFGRVLKTGTALPFDDEGRDRGLAAIKKMTSHEFDEDADSVLNYLRKDSHVGKLGAAGFCMGGHLTFRAAANPKVDAGVCFYASGLQSPVAKDGADSLQLAPSIRSKLMMIFGTEDPHIPEDARKKIYRTLKDAKVSSKILEYPCEHAFMRDEGERYDPEASDDAWNKAIGFFKECLSS